jgi:hypothetical protein
MKWPQTLIPSSYPDNIFRLPDEEGSHHCQVSKPLLFHSSFGR